MNRDFFSLLCILCVLCGLRLSAKTFDVDISTGRPAASNEAFYHGETIEFRAVRGRSVVTNIEYSCIWYTTNNSSSVASGEGGWWKTDSLVFHPTNDVGAASYRFFLEGRDDLGRDWHANGLLRFLPSPGFTPNTLPLPVATLDFAQITVLNPPWLLPDATNEFATIGGRLASAEDSIARNASGISTNAAAVASLSSRLSQASQSATNYTDEVARGTIHAAENYTDEVARGTIHAAENYTDAAYASATNEAARAATSAKVAAMVRADAIARLGMATDPGGVTNLTPSLPYNFRCVAPIPGGRTLGFEVDRNKAWILDATGGVSEVSTPAAGLEYPHYVRAVAAGGGHLAAIVREGGVWFSDAVEIAWHLAPETAGLDPTAIAYDPRSGVWWLSTYQGLYCSADRSAWTLSFPGAWRSVRWGAGTLIAGSATNSGERAGLWYARPDGTNAEWRQSNVTNFEFRALGFNGAEWVAAAYPVPDATAHGGWLVGDGKPGGILRSEDGKRWERVSGTARAYYDLCWGGGIWTALVAADGIVPAAYYSDTGGRAWYEVDGMNCYTLSGFWRDGGIVAGAQYNQGIVRFDITRRFKSTYVYSKAETDAKIGRITAASLGAATTDDIDSAIQDALDLYILNTNASITVSNRVIRVIEHDGGTNIVRYTGVDIAAYSAATNALNEAIAALRALLATKIDSPAHWADFAATGLTNGSDTVMLDRGSVTLTDGTVTWTPVGGYYFMTGSATASGNSSQFRIGTDADDWFGLEVSAAYLVKILPNSIQVSPTTVTLGTAFDPSYLTEAPHVYFTPSLGLDFEELESGVAWSQAGTNYVATVSGIADTYPSGFFRLKAMRSGGAIMRSTLPILPEGYRVEKSGAYVDTVQPDSVITVTVGGKSYKVIGEEVR